MSIVVLNQIQAVVDEELRRHTDKTAIPYSLTRIKEYIRQVRDGLVFSEGSNNGYQVFKLGEQIASITGNHAKTQYFVRVLHEVDEDGDEIERCITHQDIFEIADFIKGKLQP